MHEWLEALRKSVKASSAGVSLEELRRAETECGVPFPDELADLYQAFNGGELNGEVHLFRLYGAEGDPSVLEKTRLKLEGLPAAGLWRIGLKGQHRHLFASRKSAMVEQGDGGGPLPSWVEALDGDDWVYGTWEGEKRQMRLYRSLKDMFDVLVPPSEVESFGERTFARAMNAVLQGALSGVQVDEEEDEAAESGEAPLGAAAEAEAVEEGEQLEAVELADEEAAEEVASEVRELAYEYDDVRPSPRYEEGAGPRKARAQAQQMPLAIGGAGVLFPKSASSRGPGVKKSSAEPAPAKARPKKKAATEATSTDLPAGTGEVVSGTEAAPKKAAAKKTPPVKTAGAQDDAAVLTAQVTVAEQPVTAKAPQRAATAPARKAAAKQPVTEKATQRAATKAPARKAAAKQPVSAQAPARKSAPAKKSATAKGVTKSAQKSAAKKVATAKGVTKSAQKIVTKKAGTVKAPAQKSVAKKSPAQKRGAKRAGAPAGAAKKAAVQKSGAKKGAPPRPAAKKSPAQKRGAKRAGAPAGAAKKAAAPKSGAKKGAPPKPAAKKAAAPKSGAKKPSASKRAAKKGSAQRPAAKKAARGR